jgi:DNA-binding GntR family transcriptional regulator
MSQIQRIARASLRERVTATLRDAILSGHLKPGQKLVQKELCSSLNISRTLLREALPLLQAEGLIRSISHKGTTVAFIDVNEAKEIYAIRRVLEALAAREFARNASSEEIAELRAQLVALKRRAKAGNLGDLLVAKSDFYSVLFTGCRNQIVSQIVTQLNNRIVLYKRLSLSVSGRLSQVLEELEALVSAIEARDPERATALSELHVMNAERNVLRQLADEPDSLLNGKATTG